MFVPIISANDYEDDDDGLNKMGCLIHVTDTYGPAFITKVKHMTSFDQILNGLDQCWRIIVLTQLFAGFAGIAIWIAVRFKTISK